MRQGTAGTATTLPPMSVALGCLKIVTAFNTRIVEGRPTDLK